MEDSLALALGMSLHHQHFVAFSMYLLNLALCELSQAVSLMIWSQSICPLNLGYALISSLRSQFAFMNFQIAAIVDFIYVGLSREGFSRLRAGF